MKSLLAPRFRLLWVALAIFVGNAVLAVSPIVWELSGRRSEEYPELLFLFIGLPLSVILLIGAGFIAELRGRRARVLWLGVGLTMLAITAFATLMFAPLHSLPTSIRARGLEWVLWSLPVQLVLVVAGGVTAMLATIDSKGAAKKDRPA